jgi:CheY-like chemotaxis protein
VSLSAVNNDNALVILVVEDEILVRCGIAACLRDAGYVVVECDRGEEAIALCRSNRSIDIVFTDINLAGHSSGWDVGECFRKDRPNVPVLYTSGKSVDPQRCVLGSVFVAKPYRSDVVLQLCQRLAAPQQIAR